MRGSRGVRGPDAPLEKSQFLSNTGLDPLKHQKATKPAFDVGPPSVRHKMSFKWRFAE